MSSGDDRALVGRTIAGKFLIESFLGGGAMGKVYRARQVALEKTVAVKVMHRELASDGMFAARFHREAKAASRLDHPNSIRVIDFGEEPDGLLYLAMEFVDGSDLFQVIQNEWPLSPSRIGEIVCQALAALAVAHDMNVVHRDLKPENIMILKGKDDEGRDIDIVKVCDFGIAKINDARGDADAKGKPGAKLTTQGLVVGTPEYMSPEQGRGEPLDARSDLYSVGIILYQMLTGRVPFEAESAIGIVLKHVSEEPVPPSQVRPGVDPSIEAVCLKAMRKKREDRYQTAREMRSELRSFFDPSAAAFARAKTELVQSVGAMPHANSVATQIGTAPTVQALDSGSVLKAVASAQKTMSKVTPGGTETVGAVTAPASGSKGMTIATIAAAVALSIGGTLYVVRRNASTHVETVPSAMPSAPDNAPANAPANAPFNAPRANLAPSSNATNGEVANGNANAPPAAIASARIVPEPETKPVSAKPLAKGEKPPAHPSAAAHSGSAPIASAAIAEPTLPSAPTSSPAAAPTAAIAVTPPPAASPAPTPAPVSPPPAAAPVANTPFVPEHAFLLMHAIETTQGLAPSKVRNVLQRVHPAMNQCYRAALAAQGSASRGEAVLHIVIDDTGRVTSSTLNGAGFLPAMRPCIESSVRNLRFQDVDTGEATADVHLEFKAD